MTRSIEGSTTGRVLRALADGPATLADLQPDLPDVTRDVLRSTLLRLVRQGRAARTEILQPGNLPWMLRPRVLWMLTEHAPAWPQAAVRVTFPKHHTENREP